jgi:hypothetical protein
MSRHDLKAPWSGQAFGERARDVVHVEARARNRALADPRLATFRT